MAVIRKKPSQIETILETVVLLELRIGQQAEDADVVENRSRRWNLVIHGIQEQNEDEQILKEKVTANLRKKVQQIRIGG